MNIRITDIVYLDVLPCNITLLLNLHQLWRIFHSYHIKIWIITTCCYSFWLHLKSMWNLAGFYSILNFV